MNEKKKLKKAAKKQTLNQPIVSAGVRNESRLLMLLLALLAFMIYSNSLKNGFVLDDNSAISSNVIVQKGWSGIPEIFKTEYRAGYWQANGNLYRPLSLAVFAAIWEFKPNNPYPGHLLNVLLYMMTAVLLFRLLTRLLKGSDNLLPFLITLLFVVHPLHTEVVANIKSMDEILSFFFLLLCAHGILNHSDSGRRRPLVYIAATYFLALLSKESAITFLAVFPLMIYFFSGEGKRPYGPVLGSIASVAALYLLIRQSVLGAQHGEPYHLLLTDNSLVGAKDFMEKSASAFVLLGKYAWMQFYPYPLSCDYSYNQIPLVRWNDAFALLSLLAYVSLSLLVLLRFRRREMWVFGIAVFLITISLYSNILLTIGTNFGERLAYLPSLGFCIAFIGGLSRLIPSQESKGSQSIISALRRNPIVATIVLSLSCIASVYSHHRNADWSSYLSIYEADVNKMPNSSRLNYWYGMEVMKVRGLKESDPAKKMQYYDTALVHLDRSISINPDFADAYAQRGLLYYRRGDMDKALTDYQQAAKLKVGLWSMYSNMAIIYAQRGQFDDAMKNLNYALQVDDRPATIYKNMANIYHSQSKFPEAIGKYKEALEHMTAEYEAMVPEINNCLEECYRMIGDSANAQLYRRR